MYCHRLRHLQQSSKCTHSLWPEAGNWTAQQRFTFKVPVVLITYSTCNACDWDSTCHLKTATMGIHGQSRPWNPWTCSIKKYRWSNESNDLAAWPLPGCAAGWRRLVGISCWCRNPPVLPLHLPWCLPNHQDHRPRRCHTRSQTNPTKAQSSESESSQGTVVFLKIYHNFFSVSSFTMVYSSWSMLTTWNRTSGAVQLTDSALIMFSKSEEKPSGLTSHGQKVHPKSEIKWNLLPPLSTCVPVVFWLVLGESKKTCTIQTMQSMALALKSTLHTKSCYPRQLEGWCGRCPLQLPANSLIIDCSATHQTKTFKMSFWLRMRRWTKDDKGWRW